jgi:putative tricarboxylic transport membrane protein
MMAAFGVLGWVLHKTGFEPAPLLLAYVLGPMFERAVRQAVLIGYGSPAIFVTEPISASFLALAGLVLVGPALLRRMRRGAR